MELSLWTYEGPPHVGAMRVASAMRGVHLVLHSPQGDTYADLLFTMIERRDTRPPVTWTTFGARDLGGDTATLFQDAARDAAARYAPDLLLVGSTCTASLLQDDPGGLARALGLSIPVIALDLPAYQRKENWGAGETFYQLVRALARPAAERRPRSCNILGPTALGFRHRDDVREIRDLLGRIGVAVNVVAPLGASVGDLARLGEAEFNISLYPEVSDAAAAFLERRCGQRTVRTVPIGVGATRQFIRDVEAAAGLDPVDIDRIAEEAGLRLPWYARSVDSHYLTGKRVFVFGDATHAIAAARVATAELGFSLVGLGTYSREQARPVRDEAARYGLEPLITDDTLDVERAIEQAEPEIVLGTQMERHIAKRRGIPCAVISAPVHVEDFPARTSPFMGFEGANVLFDTFVHPLMMGLEEHLLAMFRDDPEFGPDRAPSHLGVGAEAPPLSGVATPVVAVATPAEAESAPAWSAEAERELGRVPRFVRGRARRNTERFASERGLHTISVETLYDAKAHFAR